MEPSLGQSWSEKVRPRHAPQDLALSPRGDSSTKECGNSSIYCPTTTASDLMQTAKRQAAARKPLIYLGNAERQNRAGTRRRAFKMLDAIAKLGHDSVCRDGLHARHISNGAISTGMKIRYVLFLFLSDEGVNGFGTD